MASFIVFDVMLYLAVTVNLLKPFKTLCLKGATDTLFYLQYFYKIQNLKLVAT